MDFNIENERKEAKTKRVNLLLQPSLYEKAQSLANNKGISFNELVSQVLRQVVAQHKD